MRKIKKKIYAVLTWSQKWTKTDMIYLAKNGFWLFLQNIVINFSSFFLTLAFANFISKNTYGTYQYVTSIFAILTITTVSGLNTSTVKAVASGDEGTLFTSLKIKIKYGALGSIAGFLLSAYYFINNNQELGLLFLIMSFFVPFLDSMFLYSAFLRGRQNFKALSQYSIITRVIPIILTILTVITTKNIFLILFISLSSNLVIDAILFNRCVKKFKPNDKVDIKSISLGKHLSLMGVLGAVVSQLDKMLIFHYLGATELAIYIISLTFVNKIRSLLGKITELSLPKISKKTIQELKKSMLSKIIRLELLSLITAIIYILIAPLLYKLFLPQYINSVIYSQVFAISLLFFPKELLSQVFVTQLKKKQLYFSTIPISIIKLLLFLIFIPILKIWGVILSLLLTDFIHFMILIIFFKKLKIKHRKNTNIKSNS